MGEREAAEVTLRTADLVLRFAPDGLVREAAHAGSPTSWLAGAGELTLANAHGPVPLGPAHVDVDADEVEVVRTGGGLRTMVRHAVEDAWTVRVVLGNESEADVTLTDVRLGWPAAPGAVVTALAASATALHTITPAPGTGPLLVGRLRAGAQPGAEEDGLLLGPLVLPAGHRVALQWRWDVVGRPGLVDPTGRLPPTPWLEPDQTVTVPAGPDVAVVAPGLDVEAGEDAVQVAALVPGPTTLELRSARGTTTYHLTCAPDLDDLLDVEAEALLAGPTTVAGTVRLRDAAAGLVVQDVLRRRQAGPAAVAGDALDLLVGLLEEQADEQTPAGPDPLAPALLAREADRSGGPSAHAALEAATRALRTVRVPTPGAGLAGIAVALARVRAGLDPAPAVTHLARLLDASTPSSDEGLELAVLLRPDPGGQEPVLGGLRRLGASVGAGLPGRVLPAVGLERLALVSVVLGLVDEGTGERLRREWGTAAAEVARRTAAEVRARVAERPGERAAGRALAWLVLGRTAT